MFGSCAFASNGGIWDQQLDSEGTMTCAVIVAFFVQPTNTVGGQAQEIVDLADEERYRDRLRVELGLPGASVRLFREGQWGMPPVETKQDLKRQDVFAEFVGHAARALEDLEVADEVVARFAQEQFEELHLPTSGRVIFFQAITARQSMLGRLLEAGRVQGTEIDKKSVVSSRTCDICGNDCPSEAMQQFPASAISTLSKQGFMPRHLPRVMQDMVSADMSLATLWEMTVAVNDTDWGLCQSCAAEVRDSSMSMKESDRTPQTQHRNTQPDQAASDRVAAFFGGILLGSIIVILLIYVIGTLVAPFTDALDLSDIYSWSGMRAIGLGGLGAGLVIGIVLAVTDTGDERKPTTAVAKGASPSTITHPSRTDGASDTMAPIAGDIREQQLAIAEMDEQALRAVLDGTPDYSLKLLAALRLYGNLARDAGIYTWPEQLPILAQLIKENRDREITFDKSSFVAMIDRLEPYEIAYAVELHPVREVAETILEQTINLRLAGPSVRAAFADDNVAEAAFAKALLPYHADIYAATFCQSFEDKLALANRVAREWTPHPELNWMSREDAVSSAFAGTRFDDFTIANHISDGNAAIVNQFLQEKLAAAVQVRQQLAPIEASDDRATASPKVTHNTFRSTLDAEQAETESFTKRAIEFFELARKSGVDAARKRYPDRFADPGHLKFVLRNGVYGALFEFRQSLVEGYRDQRRYREAAPLWRTMALEHRKEKGESSFDVCNLENADYEKCEFLISVLLGVAASEHRRVVMRSFFGMVGSDWWIDHPERAENTSCDSCTKPMKGEPVFINGSYLRCSDCVNRSVDRWEDDGLQQDYFGKDVVRQAAANSSTYLNKVYLDSLSR